MSKSSKTNSTQTTNGTTNVVQTPTNPAFVQPAIQGLSGQITNLAAQDPYSFVAGADPLQTQAAAGAAGLNGTPWAYDGASDVTRGIANQTAPDIAALMAKFQSPYTDQVVNTTLAGFDQNAGYSRAGDQLARAGDTTFGGSGGAIQTALNEQNLSRDRASTEATLRNQGYQTALGGATSQAGVNQQNTAQRLAAAGQLAGIANDYGANQRANVGTQSDIGAMLQQLAQNHATAPLATTGALTSMYGSLPLGLLHGQDTNGTENSTTTGNSTSTVSDPLGTFGSILGGAGSLASGLGSMGLKFSDRRLKTDIKKVGKLDDGLGVFSYRYKSGGPTEIGVMAQEVARVNPRAVHNFGGLLAVDYGAL